ncbi:MAG: alkene reductase [Betaproteobacteria bacterium]|nr:alkene reductase [Betaproteobacteria bacterium]MDE2423897.1 alkene reductase [Betaproteobacteria bacterium]
MKLLTPVQLGSLKLSNRVVMAPLTRMRSAAGDVPGQLAAEYYAQRASAGLIITEATQICPLGKGYPGTPGIYSEEQIQGWQKVTSAIHSKGGKVVMQLWHVGRISHTSHHPEQGLPIAPSAIAPSGQVFTAQWGQEPYETPREMTKEDIHQLINEYKVAAENAKRAGFDGVEVHAANGYLLDQFLQNGTNHRTDEYGGSIENRCRLLMQVLEQVIAIWGSDRVGVRLSPYGSFNDMSDSDPISLFNGVIDRLNSLHLAYLHLIEPRSTMAGGSDQVAQDMPSTATLFSERFEGQVLMAGGYNRDNAEEAINSGHADAVAFGRIYIANPDLVERFAANAPLNTYDRSTFYGGNEKGYTDYPSLN